MAVQLSTTQIVDIVDRYNSTGVSLRVLAVEYGVSIHSMVLILSGVSYGNVARDAPSINTLNRIQSDLGDY